MAEASQFTFTHKEIAEMLVKKQGIHDGVWGIFVRFGIKGANIGASDSDLMPSAIVPILEIGLQKFTAENNLSVDASKVNPVGGSKVARQKR